MWLIACTTVPEATENTSTALDLTQDYPESGPGLLVLESGPISVPPHTEVLQCTVGTWTGEDLGVTDYGPRQAEQYGHHAQLFSTDASAEEYPDGLKVDCQAGGIPTEAFFQPMQLPEGVALYFASGIRWVIQSHYVNTSDQTILVNDAILLENVPASEVETWAASWNFGDRNLIVPTGESVRSFSYTWPQDFELMTLSAHMHENGQNFSVDHTDLAGTTTRVLELDSWEDSWRDDPPTQNLRPGEITVEQGDIFTINCGFNNETGEEIAFPTEMCGAFGVGTSAQFPLNCEGD
jgi:hypothetical protein